MPLLTVEGVAAAVHADRCSTHLGDNHIRSTRSNPTSAAGAATVSSDGATIRGVPNTLPSGVSAYIPEIVEILSSAAAGPVLFYEAVNLGTIDTATGAFTDGVAFPTRTTLGVSRQLSGQVIFEMTADMVSQRTLTVTYVNQDGVAGRSSASHAITVNAVKNSTGFMVLQAGDTGVQDVTSVAVSGGSSPSGVIQMWGIIPVCLIPPSYSLSMLTKNLLAEGVVRRLAAGTNLRFLRLGTQAAERSIAVTRFVHDTPGAAPAGNSRPLDSVGQLMENDAAFGTEPVGLNVRHTPAGAAGGVAAGFQTVMGWDRDYVVPSMAAGLDGAVISNYNGHAASITEQALVWKTVLGTLTVAGNSFAAGATMPSRKHYGRTVAEQVVASRPVLYVKTNLSGGTFATVTITYTNQAGVSGRVATVGPLPTANPPAGAAYLVTPHLQSGDTGMLSVQSMSVSGVTGGVFELWGAVELACEICFSGQGGQNVQVTIPQRPPLLLAGDLLNVLRFNSATSVGSWCNFDLVGVKS